MHVTLTATMPRVHGKRVRDVFFTLSDHEGNIWVCKYGTTRKGGRGYENFLSHVRKQHPADLNALHEDTSHVSTGSVRATTSLLFPRKTLQIHGWLDYVVMGLQPFSFVESEVHRRFSKFESISVPTLKNYMTKLTCLVEQKITATFPDKFTIILGGWLCNTTHYVALLA